MRIAPDARIDDGLLDLVIVREVSRLRLLASFPRSTAASTCGHPAVDDRPHPPGRRFTIDRAMTIYGGGEPLRPVAAGEPVSVEVVPGGLGVVA